MDKLDEMVFLAIGRAQMCWKEFPTGASDEDRAYEVGKQLVTAIREYMQEKTQQPAPTYVPYPVYPLYPYNPLFPYQWICGPEQVKITWNADTAANPKGY